MLFEPHHTAPPSGLLPANPAPDRHVRGQHEHPGVSLPEGIRKAPLVLSYPFTPPPPPLLELSLPPPLSPAPTPPQSKLSPAPTPEKAPTTIAGCEWAVLRCCRPEVELGDSRGQ
ncbi:hypothetical protein C0Q70_18781 [Pomacea canaliculata]|uniref:Uncharacterized protein n=1 Tax=Pomacea canaliculata TaxID=400727 RepID=A0A2T7NHH2_POMCA|nr:hypothetical protein C0Q70_18781 [Pomacea canaliculata]